MLKHIIALLALSALVILGMSYAQQVVQAMLTAHEWIANLLMQVFNGGKAGSMMRDLIALLAIPVCAAVIPLTLYGLIKKHTFPYFMEIAWIVWLVQVGALAILYASPSV